MISEIKSISDTCLHQHLSTTLLLPIQLLSSINSNNISMRKRKYNDSLKNSKESINNNYNNLINTHFPIANIQQESTKINKTSSSQLPTVPKQTNTFIHRLVNKFFSITNINQNKQKLSSKKRIKQKQIKSILNTKILSDNSHTLLNMTSNKPLKKQRQQRHSKIITNNNKHCAICRKYRNYFSMSPMTLNTNAIENLKNESSLKTESSKLLSNNPLQKVRTLNESQRQAIVSSVECIFDTLISNYQ